MYVKYEKNIVYYGSIIIKHKLALHFIFKNLIIFETSNSCIFYMLNLKKETFYTSGS